MNLMNPLWWLHLRIGGRPRSHLYMALGYVLIVILAVTVSHRFYFDSPGASTGYFFGVWTMLIGGAQGLFLLMLIPSAIKRIVQRDYISGMVDSHRISPMGGPTIVLGYVVGPALPSLALFVPGIVIGAYFSSQSAGAMGVGPGVSASMFIGGWLMMQLLLLIAAFMVASIALLSAIATREGKFNILGFMIAASVFGGTIAIAAVPGLALLTGVMSGSYLFSSISKGVAMGGPSTLMTSTVLQVAVSVTLLHAAAKKFRSPERALFPVPTSLVLVGLWAITLVIGMAHFSDTGIATQMLRRFYGANVAFSLIAFLLVALFALHAAASRRVQLDRAAVFEPDMPRTQATLLSLMPALMFVVAMIVLGCLVGLLKMDAAPPELRYAAEEPYMWAAVAIAVALACWTDYNLLYIGAAYRVKPWQMVLLAWGVLKIGPPLLDAMIAGMIHNVTDQTWTWYGYLTAASPIGTLARTLDPCFDIGYGLAFQALVAVVTMLLARSAHRKLSYRAASAGPLSPAQQALSAQGRQSR